MGLETLSFQCECGQSSSAFLQIAVTHDHEMVFRWWCVNCEEIVSMRKRLSDLWRECPKRQCSEEDPPAVDSNTELNDTAFLSAVGISVPADLE